MNIDRPAGIKPRSRFDRLESKGPRDTTAPTMAEDSPSHPEPGSSKMDLLMPWWGKEFDAHDFLVMDERFGMTNGRKIARFLSRFRWYAPGGGRVREEKGGGGEFDGSESESLLGKKNRPTKKPPPSVDSAWAYFEHITLPRRIAKETGDEIAEAVMSIKAEPGDSSTFTKLYNPFRIEHAALADFGIGMGGYL